MEWTQGSRFSFKPGDSLYDTEAGYADWATALTKLEVCLQVQSAEDAVPATGESPRFDGRVRFNVYRPNAERSTLDKVGTHHVSQDEFVAILIGGMPTPSQ